MYTFMLGSLNCYFSIAMFNSSVFDGLNSFFIYTNIVGALSDFYPRTSVLLAEEVNL